MSGDVIGDAPVKAKPASKPAKPISAAKASKPARAPKVAPPAARTNAKGAKLRCQVGTGSRQCSNPGRWAHGKGFTCTTHHLALGRGAKLEIKGSATAVWAAPAKPATAKAV
jgi:hypothetical protein